jgi:fatty-acyl-CoA synthase
MTTTPGDETTTSIGTILTAFARHHDRVAITHARGEWTYQHLLDRIYRMARVLHGQGLGRGDVVALLTGNRPETVVLRYAANALGCTTTILYDDLANSLLAQMLRTTDATALVFSPESYATQANAAVAEVPGTTLLALGEYHGATDLTALAEAESADPIEIGACPDGLASIRLTGGSTGAPKGVPRDFRAPRYLSAEALAGWHDATQLLCTPVGHLGGTLAEMVLAAGGRVVLHERFDAGEVLAAIARERVTHLWLQPNRLLQLVDHPAVEATDTSSLRSLTYGGWTSAPHRISRALKRFGPILVQGYGTLEVGQITWLTAEEHLRPELLTTVGRVVPGVQVSIRDAAGEPVEVGGTGEIWVRGPYVMTGYYKQPEQSAKVLTDGWFHTGDLGFFDEDSYLHIVGRSKDVIIAADGHVHPSAIEDVLLAHPAIQSAVVFGFTTSDNDEQVCAAVVPAAADGLSEQDVVRWVAEKRGAAYAPEVVLIFHELPTTGSHKPDRAALRQIVAERRSAQPHK